MAKKVGQRFEQSFGANPFQDNNPAKKEGSVSIDKVPSNKRNSRTTVGEYVDYEEID